MDKLGDLDSIPAPDWEYYDAWMQCLKIRHLVKKLQEAMQSGMSIHDLVEQPTLDKLGEEMHQLWWHTQWKEEDIQVKYFGQIWDWKKKAKQHYSNLKLILDTRVVHSVPEYKLTFQNFWNGEIISHSDQLPVQAEWSPVDNFWLDTRRYDFAV